MAQVDLTTNKILHISIWDDPSKALGLVELPDLAIVGITLEEITQKIEEEKAMIQKLTDLAITEEEKAIIQELEGLTTTEEKKAKFQELKGLATTAPRQASKPVE